MLKRKKSIFYSCLLLAVVLFLGGIISYASESCDVKLKDKEYEDGKLAEAVVSCPYTKGPIGHINKSYTGYEAFCQRSSEQTIVDGQRAAIQWVLRNCQ